MLPAPGNRNICGVGVDAVLNELGNGLQRIALGKRNDADSVPVITDPQFAFLGYVQLGCAFFVTDMYGLSLGEAGRLNRPSL